MAAPVQTLALGVQDSFAVRAVAKLSPNTRVRGTTDFVGTALDVVTFPGPPLTISLVGQWIVPNTRCFANFLPTINQPSAGLATTITAGITVPMIVVQPDTRIFTT